MWPCNIFLLLDGITKLDCKISFVVQSLSCVWLFATLWTEAYQASLSLTVLGVFSNSCPLSRWCHPTVSFSVAPFSSCPQSFPALGSFPMSQLFISGGQAIGVSASVLPVNIQSWFPLGFISLISLLSKGLTRVFSSTTVQFSSVQLLSCVWLFATPWIAARQASLSIRKH